MPQAATHLTATQACREDHNHGPQKHRTDHPLIATLIPYAPSITSPPPFL